MEFFAKVVVQPGVEEGIVDGRGHGNDMGAEKEHFVVFQFGTMEFSDHVNDVQGQPADGKDHHHGDQHAVRAFLPADFHFFASARATGQRPTGQDDPDFVIAEGDDGEWNEILKD